MQKVIVHLSTYLPFKEGISTYTYNLLTAQKKIQPNLKYKVVAMDIIGIKPEEYPSYVIDIIRKNIRSDYQKAAEKLNNLTDVAIVFIQHEYGIFGGETGEYLLDFLNKVQKPVFTTLHTVLPNPAHQMKKITQEIINKSSGIIVMTKESKKILLNTYDIKASSISLIRHGIHPVTFTTPAEFKSVRGIRDRFILGTFGFLGEGKGIEYVIRALPKVIEKYPNTEYWLMGKTHPIVLKNQGEEYRERLVKEINQLGLSSHVKFYNKYLTLKQILNFLKMVDLYIVTALEPTQAVSGTFSYALGVGRPLVSTSFLQAKEFMQTDLGELVDFKNANAYAQAIIKLLGSVKRRDRIQKRAYKKTRGMLFTNIAYSYLELANNIISFPRHKLKHVRNLTNDFGIFQFATGTKPDPEFGFTLDDNARALIFIANYYQKHRNTKIWELLNIYLNFIEFCQTESGEFVNYISKNRDIEETNPWQNLDDSNGRALWALGSLLGGLSLPKGIINKAQTLWSNWENAGKPLHHPRAISYYIKGLYLKGEYEKIAVQADLLFKYYLENAKGSWQWFLQELTYANGILPEAMFLAYSATKDRKLLKVAISTLKFLISHTFNDGLYIPIGQAGWFAKDKERAYFDQQPEDPYATLSALGAAYEVTGNANYLKLARRVMLWYYGNNLLGKSLYDSHTGGCYDGLTINGVNPNEGAESTISYHLALQLIKNYE